MVRFELIRTFLWRVAAAADRVLVLGPRRIADVVAVAGMLLWCGAALGDLSPAATAVMLVFGPYLGWTYLVDRRLAAEVAGSRTGMETVRDLRVEVSLRGSERVIAFEAVVLPIAVLSRTAAFIIAAIICVKAASVVVHAELPPQRSVWAAARARLGELPPLPTLAPST